MDRWWQRYGVNTVLAGVVLSVAWFLKQTQAAPLTEAYYFLVNPWQSNQQLELADKLTNAKILELEQRVIELEQQNHQLKKVVDWLPQQHQTEIVAPIIGRSVDHWWNQVTLGKGAKDGIKTGFTVTGIGGLIGRVVQVTPHTSRVLLVSDTNSRVGAVVSRSRQVGYIQGQYSQTAIMRFFAKVTDVKPGDAIATSHLSHLYPAGLPIGRVKSVNIDNGPAPEAEIELIAPIELLEWVIVRPYQSQLNKTKESQN